MMGDPEVEEEEEEESYYQSYQRFLKAREEKNDAMFEDILHQYDDLPDDTRKLEFLNNNVMLEDQYELFECLLRLRRDDILSLEDDKESGLVHYASMNNHPAFVYILAMLHQKDAEIDLDGVNYYSQTPIVLACTYGHEDVLEVFLRYAPHVDLTDAIEVAQFSDNPDLLDMLFDEKEERSAMKIFRKIRSAADDMKKAKYLKDFDACEGKTSDRQLMFMTKLMDKNEMEMFKMLITVRVEILTARDEDGWTILHSAVSQNCNEAVSTLIRSEVVDVNATDLTHTTPLMLACRSFKHTKVLSLLLERGCDVLMKDNCGWNALDIAKRAKQRDVVTLLEEYMKTRGLVDDGKLAGQYL